MIHLPASVRVYLATTPGDMRRSFDLMDCDLSTHKFLPSHATRVPCKGD